MLLYNKKVCQRPVIAFNHKSLSMKETPGWIKCGFLLAVIFVLVSILYPLLLESEEDTRIKMDNVLQSLLLQEKSVNIRHQAKIAVGYGACKDMFVDGKEVLDHGSKPDSELRNHNEIENWNQLLEMYGYFFSHGAAAE